MKKWWRDVRSFFSFTRAQTSLDFWGNKEKRARERRKKIIWILGGILFLYVFLVLWPLRSLVWNGFLSGKTLILFTNEAEARPCGGFMTAFGVVQVFPPKIELKNAYALSDYTFGKAEAPLSQVSETKNFWDLGTSVNLEECASAFEQAYEEARKESISQVILFDLQTAEEIFHLFAPLKIGDRWLHERNFFAELSRIVSDVDRHDETALQNRKTPLSHVGKKILWRTFLNPLLLPKATNIIAENIASGDVFIPDISPRIQIERTDFSLIEWNLGGAKSSRFLEKLLQIFVREIAPGEWDIQLQVNITHTGGIDEPLSQNWKGGFEVVTPKFLGIEPVFLEAEISPGETFSKTFSFQYKGTLNEFSVFRPRGQRVAASVLISLFPQQTFLRANFDTHENSGQFIGNIEDFRRMFRWETAPDKSNPFITLHEVISFESLPSEIRWDWGEYFLRSDTLFFPIEIHLNEKIRLKENFSVQIRDRDFENTEITEDILIQDSKMLKDQRTLLLLGKISQWQNEERFSIEIEGMEDFFGNPLSSGRRTLMLRR
ncbi:DUF4012 domain-containing protein [Candidatus Gracilibacteria bacterium]|nr:DUF4012 domain-containing protein [Candidatus Gracilibacteria bacterium]MCF7819130.1 DUF4012 domain-containing protein [Candidatus Gracilibacteria bacterium]